MNDRPVWLRSAMERALHDMKAGAYPTDQLPPQISAIGGELYDDRKIVDGVRRVLVGFGVLEESDHDTDLVALLEMLLPPN